MKNESAYFWHDLSDSEKSEIKEGIEQLNSGRRISYSEFRKNIF